MVARPTLRSILFAGALLGLAVAASADTIELKNGQKLEGTVVQETDDMVVLDMDIGRMEFERKLVARIVRDGDGGAGPTVATPDGVGPSPLVAGAPIPAREWATLWSEERRVGWRRREARSEDGVVTFEESITFVDAEGRVEATIRMVEEADAALGPRSFLYQEDVDGTRLSRRGKVVGDRLRIEILRDGETRRSDHPLPPGFRFPLGARAFVLREGERLPDGWRGSVYDPRRGEFATLHLRADRSERVRWNGAPVEVVVLVRRRGEIVEEERVTADGAVLTADLNAGQLIAVKAAPGAVEALEEGELVPVSEDEERSRSVWISPEDGFRIRKPGLGWEFVPGARDTNPRIEVRDVNGIAWVSVAVEAAPDDPPLIGLGAALERRLRSASAEFEKLEDGYEERLGRPAYRLLADARLRGDAIRTAAWVLVHDGRAWTFTVSCPVSQWEEARPYLERIVDGFEWL